MNNLELLKPYDLGDGLLLKNRIVMAPMTRSRAFVNNIPYKNAHIYYSQRVSAGLIITEGTVISPEANGYLWTPGIFSKEQKDEWKKITDAVHNKDGKIFVQLWHVGRMSLSKFHDGKPPLAPSAIPADAKIYNGSEFVPCSVPKAMTIDDIKRTVEDFRIAAISAKECGFDGIDIHGAFGYLIDQFLSSGTNKREDEYGGTLENRTRFALEVLDAVTSVWADHRVGIKLSPSNLVNDILDDNPAEIYGYLIEKLNNYKLAYLMLMEPQADVSNIPNYITNVAEHFRKVYKHTLMGNANMTKESGELLLEENLADLIAYGVPFISNPDLPIRFEKDYPLSPANRKGYYGGDDKGYIDYPTYEEILQNGSEI